MLSTWVYAVVLFAIAFLAMLSAGGAFSGISVGMGADKVHANAPQSLNGLITVFAHFGVLITASVFGQALHQDQENRIDGLFFTTPIRKIDYLGGRFLGAVVFSLLIFLPIALGLWFGTIMPFVEKAAFGPNHLSAYLWPYVTTVLPNIIFSGALFFALNGLTRKMMPVYVGSVVLVIGYLMAGRLFSRLDYRMLAAVLDPFGLTATRLITEYRTASEQNTLLVPLTGAFFLNRLVWLGVGAALFLLTLRRFRLAQEGTAERKPRITSEPVAATVTAMPVVVPQPEAGRPKLLFSQTRLALRETVKDVYFGVIVLAGLLFMVVATLQAGALYGTATYPVTRAILELTGGTFELFILILLTFYSGELVWRERDAHVAQITDALPVPTWLPFLSKLFALFLVQGLLLGILLVGGVVIQTFKGYFHYELGLYVQTLYELKLPDYMFLCVLAFAVHIIVNHKYVGHFVMVLYYISTIFMPKLGLEHNLYKLGDHPEVPYSDMNRFGHYLQGRAWFHVYWGLFAVLLALACSLLWPRGVEDGVRFRLREARRRFGLPGRLVAAAALLGFIGVGGFIYWNTNVLNHYETTKNRERDQADYEKAYKSLENAAQPRVVAVNVAIDIFPRGAPGQWPGHPALHARGRFDATNKSDRPIPKVYLNLPNEQRYEKLAVGDVATPTAWDPKLGFYTFDLPSPLMPGQTTPIDFDIWYVERGFSNDQQHTEIAENGTFFHSSQLPIVGYIPQSELSDDGARKKYGLPPRTRMADLDDANGRSHNYVVHDGDWITFQTTVSTSADEIALAPGYIQKEWTEGDRHFTTFAMDQKILDFFSVLSGRYAVKRATWNDIPLEVYYHPTHPYDVDRMLEGMKDALEYCSKAFGPYQHRQARIIEFPRYQTYAQSFPNTIPFSEAVGFVAKVDPDDPKDVDYPYYITAHEIAHQWWAHQVVGADVQGSTMLSETLAQYSALMVMKKKVGPERMKRFLEYELDGYLRSRAMEQKKEVPLLRVENQPYIHYQKGSLVMYALQDYAGEEAVNRGLAAFLVKTRFGGPPYPTSRDLLASLKEALPPELAPLLVDLIETITLFDNRATSATARALPDGKYEVTVKVSARKIRADESGAETDLPLNDLIDVGAIDDAGVALFREKRRFTTAESTQTFIVDHLPAKAGIDPLNILVDRKPDDNVVRVVVQ